MRKTMQRTGRGAWVGMFRLDHADPAAVEEEIRVYLSRVSALFTRSEVCTAAGGLRLFVTIREHVPGRGFGSDSAVIENLEHYISETIRLAQPPPPPPRRSVYEWLRAPAL